MKNLSEVLISILVMLIAFGAILWILMIFFRKFFGTTLTTRSNIKSTLNINRLSHEYYISRISQYDPGLINKAKSRIKAKFYANTSENLYNEINKIVEENNKCISSNKINQVANNEKAIIKNEKYLIANSVKNIMSKRILIPFDAVGKSVIFIVERIELQDQIKDKKGHVLKSFSIHNENLKAKKFFVKLCRN